METNARHIAIERLQNYCESLEGDVEELESQARFQRRELEACRKAVKQMFAALNEQEDE